jgi:hypothetical protein
MWYSKESLFRQHAAATDAQQRPGFPTNTPEACATQEICFHSDGV